MITYRATKELCVKVGLAISFFTFESDSDVVGRTESWTVGDKWDNAQEAGNHTKGSCHRIVESYNNYHLESVICFVRYSMELQMAM